MSALTDLAFLTQSSEVDFPEFTAKLISDIFDAIITSNLKQIEAYSDLLLNTQKSLYDFVYEAKNFIGGDLILRFLVKVLPDNASPLKTKITENNNSLLTAEEALILNDSVFIPEINDPPPANSNLPIKLLYLNILDAVAKRISADKYYIIKELIKVGALKILVKEGELESKLTFNTYRNNFYSFNSLNDSKNTLTSNLLSSSNQTAQANENTHILSKWINASSSTSITNLKISTANTKNNKSPEIFGSVKLKFISYNENSQV